MGLFDFLGRAGVSPEAVRAEIWRLGVRHFGEPLQGALAELADPGLAPDRTALLRACVAKLRAA
ncbi:hypothetical protein [Phenylobacterium sp.]|uniref:hypothetical protein n=1 Tax=Phenylobacterium sp. TaxID=1871053 RepID=UPI002B86813D|nr:hypothetical protein [Phenylobacterium sp.]HVI32279.1 hypothetical protein [Phenylobacterium sp.]